MAKSTYTTIAEANVKLPSGYYLTVAKKKSSEGKIGLNLQNKKFFFPIALEDAKAVADAILEIESK